jgi:hypothetical protein
VRMIGMGMIVGHRDAFQGNRARESYRKPRSQTRSEQELSAHG